MLLAQMHPLSIGAPFAGGSMAMKSQNRFACERKMKVKSERIVIFFIYSAFSDLLLMVLLFILLFMFQPNIILQKKVVFQSI